MIKRDKVLVILQIVIPIIIGGCLYYFFCPDIIFVKFIDEWLGITYHIDFNVNSSIVMRLIRNYFFDFLWSYALTFMIFYILNDYVTTIWLYIMVSSLLGIVMELMQLIGIAKGTFDFGDIAVEIFGAIIVSIIIYFWRNKVYGKKEEA